MTDSEIPAKYNVAKVEAVILEVVAELHEQHSKQISTGWIVREIVENVADAREVETASRAIHNLREVGLFSPSDDGKVKPTPAGLHAVRLLT
jgi:hypothetical protein